MSTLIRARSGNLPRRVEYHSRSRGESAVVYAPEGGLTLSCNGAVRDLPRLAIERAEGVMLPFLDGDLIAIGEVYRSPK